MEKKHLNQLWSLSFIIILSANLLACNSKVPKEKGLVILAPAEMVEKYQKAFDKYFASVVAIENTKAIKIGPSDRYLLKVQNNAGAVSREPADNAFLIDMFDNKTKVKINIIYTSGAKSSNATVINPNLISGSMTINKSLDFVPDENLNDAARINAIALFIKQTLVSLDQ
mgnify:CR=1 FL=1